MSQQSRTNLRVDTTNVTFNKKAGGTEVIKLNNLSVTFPATTIKRLNTDGTPGDWKDYNDEITITGEYQLPLTSSYVIGRGDTFTGSADLGEASGSTFRVTSATLAGAIRDWNVGTFNAEQMTTGT